MLEALTWQHQVLVAETIISASIGLFMITRGPVPPNVDRSMFFLLWNAVLFWLLFSGATHNAWQYWVVTAWYVLDTLSVVKGIAKPRTLNVQKPGGALIFCTLVVTTIVALIITGA